MSTGGDRGAALVGFRRHLRPEVVAGEAAYLFSEAGVTALQGSGIEVLAPLLDGTRDLHTLLAEASRAVPCTRVEGLVSSLTAAGLLSERPHPAPAADEPALAYWESAGLEGEQAVARTRSGRVHLTSVGRLDTAPAEAALRAAGLTVTSAAAPAARAAEAELTIVLCDDYLASDLAEVDAAHRAAGRPWLLARPHGRQVWVGPFFRPDGACWHCLAHRMWGHRRAEAHVQGALGRSGPAPRPDVSLPVLRETGVRLVALEAVKWLAGYRYDNQQSVWTFETLTMEGRHHELRPRPQCPSCGDPGLVAAQVSRPVVFGSRPKAADGGGGDRARSPEETLRAYRHLVSPVTGVVKEIRRDPHGPAFLNSFVAGSNVAAGAHGLGALRAGLRSDNGGKGVTALHAEVSALCEALERHSGYFHGDEPTVRGSLRSLGDRAVPPDSWQLFHDRQYEGREEWNARHSAFQYVPPRFDEDTAVDWTPLWSVTGQRHRLLPTAALYFGAPREPGTRFFRPDSNGNAAGSSLEDAVLQGFMELVERDAVALWWYNRTRQQAVDLDAFGDRWIDELREVHADLNREVWALDISSDLGIPVVAAFSRRTDKEAEDIVFGLGAHFDPRTALRRALTEVNQLLPAVIGARPDGEGYRCGDPDTLRWWRTATIADQPYVAPDPSRTARGPDDYAYTPRRDLRDDLAEIERLTARHGLELLVLDQTRPDIGLPVVKVVVPGLRHFWSRFAPGRLYDVPVRLGRLAEPTPYEQLNPIPVFI
jgi:oxazoline/thiazoline synthase